MGACLSKRTGKPPPTQNAINGATAPSSSSSPPLPSAAAATSKVQYVAALSSYEAACRLDPELRSFDATLQVRTSRAISTLATGVEVQSLSFDSLREVTACLLDMNQEVVKVILDCKKDVWKSPQLFDLVEEYFDNSLHTLDFCAALERCLHAAQDSQLIVHVALQRFAEEDDDDDGDEHATAEAPSDSSKAHVHKYARTLEELRSFRARGDPFTEDFFQVLQSVHRHQLSMLEKLQRRKLKLDRKLRSAKAWRKVSSIIFAAAFASVLICSVVAAAVAAPPVAAALAAATSIPLGSMGKWFDSLWKDYQDALTGHRELISTMQVGAFVVIKDLDNIRVLVEQLETQMSSLLQAADFAMRDDEQAVRVAVEEIRRKLGAFMRSIEELGEQSDMCSRDIRRARTVVLQKIIKHPNS
ncbi:hypothetical protein Taro_002508 [Colocasia esculenta]|uniref:Uncharacterized protein n=1 Tax=Colocasia esculenta TaxID=4460 RepID=A0A843TED0_COLES|nr:hypothetical protein [Colocasia esculenta]